MHVQVQKFQVFGDSLKTTCCNPPSNFQVKQSPGCSTSVEDFVNLNELTPMNDAIE